MLRLTNQGKSFDDLCGRLCKYWLAYMLKLNEGHIGEVMQYIHIHLFYICTEIICIYDTDTHIYVSALLFFNHFLHTLCALQNVGQ